jgi:hypothetical protein
MCLDHCVWQLMCLIALLPAAPILLDSAWQTAQLSSVSSPKMVMLVLARASDRRAAADNFLGSSSGGSRGPKGGGEGGEVG